LGDEKTTRDWNRRGKRENGKGEIGEENKILKERRMGKVKWE
jgi:hypothetical protein